MARSRRSPPQISDISAASWNSARRTVHEALKYLVQHLFESLPAPHEETHLVGGSDALQTPGNPATLDPNLGSAIGAGPSFAREDHRHALDLKLTTKGDLLTRDTTAYIRKAQEAVADGSVLLKDSAQATGMRWGPVGETDQAILAVEAYTPHPPRIPQSQAGTAITITNNALGPIISSIPDSDQGILANQVFGG